MWREQTARLLSVASIVTFALAAAALRRRIEEARQVEVAFERYRKAAQARGQRQVEQP